MKKAIISTILAISSIGAVVASSVFLPALVATKEYSPIYMYDYESAINNWKNNSTTTNNNFSLSSNYLNSSNIDVIDAIYGSKKINNGNYILYIGSEGNANHRSFLYNQSSINDFENDLLGRSLVNSNFGDGLQYLNSTDFATAYDNRVLGNTNSNNTQKTYQLPKVLTYIDKLDYTDFQARIKFQNLINEYKKLPTSKDSEEGKDLSDDQIKENTKKKEWANKNISFSFEPGATYEDWDGKTQYFRVTYESGLKYNKLVEYITNKFSSSATSNTRGIVLAWINDANGNSKYKFLGTTIASTSTRGAKLLENFVPKSNFSTELKEFYLQQ